MTSGIQWNNFLAQAFRDWGLSLPVSWGTFSGSFELPCKKSESLETAILERPIVPPEHSLPALPTKVTDM